MRINGIGLVPVQEDVCEAIQRLGDRGPFCEVGLPDPVGFVRMNIERSLFPVPLQNYGPNSKPVIDEL